MSEDMYEVAFSGEILEGADLQQVKAKVAAIFKADDNKLAQLFSGKRVVIKKNIDQATANKYKMALQKAGASCEVLCLSKVAPAANAATETVQEVSAQKEQATQVPTTQAPTEKKAPAAKPTPTKTAAMAGDIPAAPNTDPLGIQADEISEWSASVAPVGSPMQDEIKVIPEPELSLEGLDIAPPGSDLGQAKKASEPPPPDTDGLSLVD